MVNGSQLTNHSVYIISCTYNDNNNMHHNRRSYYWPTYSETHAAWLHEPSCILERLTNQLPMCLYIICIIKRACKINISLIDIISTRGLLDLRHTIIIILQ